MTLEINKKKARKFTNTCKLYNVFQNNQLVKEIKESSKISQNK